MVFAVHGLLHPFVGKELNQIALGRFQTQLHFAGTGSIFIEGGWELHDPGGLLIDARTEHAARDCYRIHRVLDLPVASFEIHPPSSFTLVFEPRYRLTVFDDMPQNESFSVHLLGRAVVYI